MQPPNTTTPITFRILLQHTAGIADGAALDNEYFGGQDSPNDLSVLLNLTTIIRELMKLLGTMLLLIVPMVGFELQQGI